ncbi:MAG: hypothetical protein QW569_07040 [Candidatus Bathyarchaeia archaeon]|nr:hypothetical protein [Candidatus Bathyarchaeota archaeon]
MSQEELEVHIKYLGLEKTIRGDVDLVLREIIKFFSKVLPAFELISKLTLTVDLEELLETCKGLIAITDEGVVATAPTEKLPDKDLILLYLVMARLAHRIGRSERDTMFISDILSTTKRSPGTIAGRLSELASEGLVDRVGKGEYRITTLGLDHFVRNVASKLKEAR